MPPKTNGHKITTTFKKTSRKDKILAAQNSTTSKNFKYMAGKICYLIDTRKIKLENETTRFWTPFTTETDTPKPGLRITKKRWGIRNLQVHCDPASYVDLAKIIHDELTECNRTHLNALYNYLNMPAYKTIVNIRTFNNKVKSQYMYNDLQHLKETDDELRKALNNLAAILMIAETYRYQDQGRQSRALIRTMYSKFNRNEGEITRASAITEEGAAENIRQTLTGEQSHTSVTIKDPKMSDDEYEDDYKYDDGKGDTYKFETENTATKKIRSQQKRYKEQKEKELLQLGRINRGRKSGSTRTYSLKPRTTTLHIDNDEEDSE